MKKNQAADGLYHTHPRGAGPRPKKNSSRGGVGRLLKARLAIAVNGKQEVALMIKRKKYVGVRSVKKGSPRMKK